MFHIKAPQWYDFEASEQSGLDGYFDALRNELETPKNPTKCKPEKNETLQPICIPFLHDASSQSFIEPKKNVDNIFSIDNFHGKSENQLRELTIETYPVNENYPESFKDEILVSQWPKSSEFCDENLQINEQFISNSCFDMSVKLRNEFFETPKNPQKCKPIETGMLHAISSALSYDMRNPIEIEPEKNLENIFTSNNFHRISKNQPKEVTRQIYVVNQNIPKKFNDDILASQTINSREFYDKNMIKKILYKTPDKSVTGSTYREYRSFATPSTGDPIACQINRTMTETPPEMDDHYSSALKIKIGSLTKAMKKLCIESEKRNTKIDELSLTPSTWKIGVEVDGQTSTPSITLKNKNIAKSIEAAANDQSIYSTKTVEREKFAIVGKIEGIQILHSVDTKKEGDDHFMLETTNERDNKYFKSDDDTRMIISKKPESTYIESENDKSLEIISGKVANSGIDGENAIASSNIIEPSSNECSADPKSLKICYNRRQSRDKKPRVLTSRVRRQSLIYHRQSGQFVSMAEAIMKFQKDTPKRFRSLPKIRSKECQHNERPLACPSSSIFQRKLPVEPSKFTNREEQKERLDIEELGRNHTKSNAVKQKMMKKKVTEASSPFLRCKSRSKSRKMTNHEEKEQLEIEEIRRNRIKPNPLKAKKSKKNVPESTSRILQCESGTRSSNFVNREKKERLKVEEIRHNQIEPNHLKPNKMKEKMTVESFSPGILATKNKSPSLSPLEFPQSVKKRTQTKRIVTTIVPTDEGLVEFEEEILYFGIPIGNDCRKRTPTKPFSFDVREKKIDEKIEKMRDEKKNVKNFQTGSASSLAAAGPIKVINEKVSKITKERNVEEEKNMSDGPNFQERNDMLLEKKMKFIDQARKREKEARNFHAKPAPIFKTVSVRGTTSRVFSSAMSALNPEGRIANQENTPPNVPSMQQLAKLKISQTTENSKSKKSSVNPLILNADERVKKRRIFDAMMRRKEEEAEARRREEEIERLNREKREERELRKNMQIKGRPMPIFKTPKIAKSLKPLTDPHSPAWAGRRKLLSQ